MYDFFIYQLIRCLRLLYQCFSEILSCNFLSYNFFVRFSGKSYAGFINELKLVPSFLFSGRVCRRVCLSISKLHQLGPLSLEEFLFLIFVFLGKALNFGFTFFTIYRTLYLFCFFLNQFWYVVLFQDLHLHLNFQSYWQNVVIFSYYLINHSRICIAVSIFILVMIICDFFLVLSHIRDLKIFSRELFDFLKINICLYCNYFPSYLFFLNKIYFI